MDKKEKSTHQIQSVEPKRVLPLTGRTPLKPPPQKPKKKQ